MKNISAFLISFFCLLTLQLSAQNYSNGLKILNPQQGNGSKTNAHFEKIDVTVKPIGIYSQVDIVGEVSGKYSFLQYSQDSLEIEYKFSLPLGSIMHEVYLWMNNIPVRAELYEKGRAQFIYEGLVNRRIDPIIVYKTNEQAYEARIFPVLNPGSRKFKISYLALNIPTTDGWRVPLNLEMFRSDMNGITNHVNLHVVNNTLLGTPTLENSLYSFNTNNNVSEITIPITVDNQYLIDGVHFKMNAEKEFARFESTGNPNEWYYQLSLEDTSNVQTNRKIVFILDYITNSTTACSYNSLLMMIRTKLASYLNESDSFMIIYNDNSKVMKVNTEWLQGGTVGLQQAYNVIPASPLNSSSLTEPSLDTAINFINNHGKQGFICILSNSNNIATNVQVLNQKINNLISKMDTVYKIFAVDINNFANYAYQGSRMFFNNEYFLSNLSIVTGGYFYNRFPESISYYYDYPVSSLSGIVDIAFHNLNHDADYSFTSFNNSNGLFYNNYPLNNSFVPKVKERYIEIGKFQGTPSTIHLTQYTSVNNTPYTQQHTISPVSVDDSMLKRAWGSELIEKMISQNTNNIYTNQIVAKSIGQHVLCEYTAFLALEPDTIANNVSNTHPTAVDEIGNKELLTFSAYPNPFSTELNLSFEIPEKINHKKWTIVITDVLGRELSNLSGIINSDHKMQVSWNGISSNGQLLPTGVYYATLIIEDYKATISIVKM